MDLAAVALLGLVVGVLLWRAATRERRDYGRFKRLRSTAARQKVYRRWVIENSVVLGGLSLATFVGSATAVGPALAAAQDWPPVAFLRDAWLGPWGVPIAVVAGGLVVALLVVPVLALRNSLEGSLDDAPAIGDIRALLPRSRGELPYGAALSVSAGVFEEALFRLGLPALAFAVTGDALVAFLGATVLFGALHAYQGAAGVALSTVLGVVFLTLYLVTGWIVVPIVLHVLLDLRSLVLIPIVLGRVLEPAPERRRGGRVTP